MDQAVWNTSQGRIFVSNTDDGEIGSRLSAHADFILIFFAPFYWLFPTPKVLLFVQTAILAIGAYFVFFLAKKITANKNLALAFSFAYLINPHVQRVNLYDFHAVSFATTFLLASFYFLISKKYRFFLLFAFLAALTKEHVWIVIGLFGFYLAFVGKKVKEGIALTFISFAIFYFLIFQIIPNFRGHEHFALSYYEETLSSPLTSSLNLIFEEGRRKYIDMLLSPLGYLSLLYPLYLIFALPDLAINILSKNENLHQIYYHYTAVITPFVFISAIYGARTLNKFFPKISFALLSLFITAMSLYSSYQIGPLYFSKKPNIAMFAKPVEFKEFIKSSLLLIPQEASVTATNNLGAHLTHRQTVYTIPVGTDKAEYVIFLLGDIYARPSPSAQAETASQLKKNKNYQVLAEKDGFILFKNNKPF